MPETECPTARPALPEGSMNDDSGIPQVRYGRIGSTDVGFHSVPILPICFQCSEFVEA